MSVEKWYRVDSMRHAGSRFTISVYDYPVVGKTPKGVYLDVWGYRKWVSNTARKRFAYPTEQLARESFEARKKRQVLLLSARLYEAKMLLCMIQLDYDDSALVHHVEVPT